MRVQQQRTKNHLSVNPTTARLSNPAIHAPRIHDQHRTSSIKQHSTSAHVHSNPNQSRTAEILANSKQIEESIMKIPRALITLLLLLPLSACGTTQANQPTRTAKISQEDRLRGALQKAKTELQKRDAQLAAMRKAQQPSRVAAFAAALSPASPKENSFVITVKQGEETILFERIFPGANMRFAGSSTLAPNQKDKRSKQIYIKFAPSK